MRFIHITPRFDRFRSAIRFLVFCFWTMGVVLAYGDDRAAAGVTISSIPDQTTQEDTPLQNIPFTVNSPGWTTGVPTDLTITATSTNVSLMPEANVRVRLIDSETRRDYVEGVIDLRPEADRNGATVLTLRVSDGTNDAQRSFNVTVNAINDPPTFSVIADQITNEGTPVIGIAFVVDEGGDSDEDSQTLTVTASSDDTRMIPNENITVRFADGAADATGGTIEFIPAENQIGSVPIKISISDGKDVVETSFLVTIQATNDPPSLSDIPDQVIDEDAAATEIGFSADEGGGADEDEQLLTVIATSSNTILVPLQNISVRFTDDATDATGGAIGIFPAADQNGEAIITVTVADGTHVTSDSFILRVHPKDDPPLLSPIVSVTMSEDSAGRIVPFTADEGGGADEDLQALIIKANSLNTKLIPNEGIRIQFDDETGDAKGGAIALTPAPNQYGAATITLSLSDGSSAIERSFTVTVEPANDSPELSPIPNQLTAEDTPINDIPFTADEGGDAEEDSQVITVRAFSSNIALVPDYNIRVKFADDATDATGGTIDIDPLPDEIGQTTIMIVALDRGARAERSFTVTVAAVNDPPTISAIENQRVWEDSRIANIAFRVDEGGGSDEDSQIMVVTAHSATPNVISDQGITIEFVDDQKGAGGGVIHLVPNPNANGVSAISLTATDGTNTITESFEVTVDPVDDPPVIATIEDQRATEDSVLGAIVCTLGPGGGADELTQKLTVKAVSSNAALVNNDAIFIEFQRGAQVVEGMIEGVIRITPTANESGETTITVTVDDGGKKTEENFLLAIAPVDDVPVISDIPDQAIQEDTALTAIAFVVDEGGGSDEDGQIVTVVAATSNPTLLPEQNIHISFADDRGDAAGGTLAVTPVPNAAGIATITLQVSDGTNEITETFTVQVDPVDDPPELSEIADQETTEDIPLGRVRFTASEGGVGEQDQPLIVTARSSNLTLIPDGNIAVEFQDDDRPAKEGVLQITPAADENGESIITLAIGDGRQMVQRQFRVRVLPVDDPPLLSTISDITTREDRPISGIAFTVDEGGGSDEDVQIITLTAASSNPALVAEGNCAIQVTGTAADAQGGFIDVAPMANQTGTVTITLRASDERQTSEIRFNLTVEPVNDPPEISPIKTQRTDEDSPITGISFTADEGGGVDEDVQVIQVTAVSSNPDLVPDTSIAVHFEDDARDATSGSIDIQPVPNGIGEATITLTVFDGYQSTQTQFLLAVASIKDLPVAHDGQIELAEDTVFKNGQLRAEDLDGDTLTYSIIEQGTKGEVTLIDKNAGTFTYKPKPNVTGTDRFTFVVNDGDLDSNTASVSVIITAAEDPPILSSIADQTINEDTPITGIHFEADEGGGADEDGQVLMLSVTCSNPKLIPDSEIRLNFSDGRADAEGGTIDILPVKDEYGTASISVVLGDGSATVQGAFVVTVNPVNDPPLISAIPDQSIAGEESISGILFTVDEGGGPNEDHQIVAVTATSSNTRLLPNGNIRVNLVDDESDVEQGTIDLFPVPDEFGTTTITITVDDGANVAKETFVLTKAFRGQ